MKKFALAVIALVAAATSSLAAQDPNLQDRPSLWQDAAFQDTSREQQFGIESTGSSTEQAVTGEPTDGAGSDYYR